MTMVGISALDSVTMQTQMARNAKFSQDCYQLALSEIEANSRLPDASNTRGLSNRLLVSAINNEMVPIDFNANDYDMSDVAQAQQFTQTANLTYMNEKHGKGSDISLIVGKHYALNSNCSATGGGSSNQVQGLVLLTPGASD